MDLEGRLRCLVRADAHAQEAVVDVAARVDVRLDGLLLGLRRVYAVFVTQPAGAGDVCAHFEAPFFDSSMKSNGSFPDSTQARTIIPIALAMLRLYAAQSSMKAFLSASSTRTFICLLGMFSFLLSFGNRVILPDSPTSKPAKRFGQWFGCRVAPPGC